LINKVFRRFSLFSDMHDQGNSAIKTRRYLATNSLG